MTSLVHIGDFHAKPDARNPDRYRALDQIIREGLQLPELGAWLWPGDLNDGRMSIDDKNALRLRVQQMAERAPVVICYGNHDLPGDLDFLAHLRAGFPIYVIETPECLRIRLATGENATVFVLPYPTKAGLASLGVAPADVVDVAAGALDAIFIGAAAELEEQGGRDGDLTLMIGHVNVAGSITSVGQPNIGHEIEIGTGHLERLGDIYKGLNHIHKGQQIAGAWYPGSVCRLNWGEIEEKRYLVVSYDRIPVCAICGKPAACFGCYEDPSGADQYACDGCCGHGNEDGWCKPISEGGISDAPRSWVHTVESKSIAVAPMYHVEGLLTRHTFDWQVTAGPGGVVLEKPASWRGCEVRVRYKFNQSEKSALSTAMVLAEFAEALRLEVEPIAVPDRALRSPAVAAARTLPEKVAAYCQVEQLAPAVAAKLGRLEHAEPVQILTDVQRDLRAIETPEEVTVAA